MLFKETDNKGLPTIILLHGGGLSCWSLSHVAELLKADFHLVTPIIDGHGENGGQTFTSIEDAAVQLLEYIDTQCNGKVFALGGLSLGAQIVTEALSQREDIAEFAILESSLVIPMKMVAATIVPTYQLFYGFIKKRWFSKMQAKTLFIPEDMFEQYYSDSRKISKKSLINIALSNGNYALKNSIEQTKAKVLIIAGEKELRSIKRSAEMLNSKISDSKLYVSRQMGHGELSLANPREYVKIITEFFNQKPV